MPEVVFDSPGAGNITWLRDATANDSDKSFTVPANHVWRVKSVYALIATDGTVGNRTLRCDIKNVSNQVVMISPATGSIAASQYGTLRVDDGAVNSTTAADCPRVDTGAAPNVTRVSGLFPSGGILLTAGMYIRVWDTAGIAAAADDLTVIVQYEDFSIDGV